MSDALSKADMPRFWGIAADHGGFGLPLAPLPPPRELLRWVQQPRMDFDLSRRLLRDIAAGGSVLGL